MSRLLKIRSEYSMVVSLPKSTFFAMEFKWRGRIIGITGVIMDPANYEGNKNDAELSDPAKLC